MINPYQYFAPQFVEQLKVIRAYFLGMQDDSFDVIHQAQLLAANESADYYCQKMLTARNFDSNLALLDHALSLRRPGGLIAEFGVASGTTINHIASRVTEEIYGFDVFTGLPEDWRTGFHAGAFAQAIPKVRPNVSLEVGLFDDTLAPFCTKHAGKFASLLHIDCDLYSSTVTILQNFRPMIVPGTVIVFDEYWNYPGWKHHEVKAFAEFCAEHQVTYSYNSFVSRHQQVCVVIDSIAGNAG